MSLAAVRVVSFVAQVAVSETFPVSIGYLVFVGIRFSYGAVLVCGACRHYVLVRTVFHASAGWWKADFEHVGGYGFPDAVVQSRMAVRCGFPVVLFGCCGHPAVTARAVRIVAGEELPVA